MSNPGMRLTRHGENILIKGLEGKEINFSRVAIGDGDFNYEMERVYDLTEMRSWRMNLKIVGKKQSGDGTFVLSCYESNAEVLEGFPAKEHAVFAIDPDTGEELLYSYRNVGNEYDFIPAFVGGNNVKNISFGYTVVIRDAQNVTAVIDSNFAYVSQQQFDDHINAEHPHPNTPNHFLDITETEHLWATDHDDHLHKISLPNLKNSLGLNCAASYSNSDFDIIKERERLGIDTNVLLIEDFTDPELVDMLKIKVTSSAKGGNLLGLSTAEGITTGAYYWLVDGISQELVKIIAVISNESGLHARIENRLDNQFDANSTYLMRTTAQIDKVAEGAIDSESFDWIPTETFKGLPANTPREIVLETRADKAMDFVIEGDGVLTADGFLTMV